MAKQRKARVAVVGAGWWATRAHLPAVRSHPDAELVALCDIDEKRLRVAAAHFGVARAYTDLDEMLRQESLDGAVVAVYHSAQYAVARACLDAGLHVLIEKPMVLEVMHGLDLLARAQAHGVEIIVGYPWHYTTTARRAREAVHSGQLGTVQFISSLYASMVVEFYRGHPEAY